MTARASIAFANGLYTNVMDLLDKAIHAFSKLISTGSLVLRLLSYWGGPYVM
jgi:hypothetical protein